MKPGGTTHHNDNTSAPTNMTNSIGSLANDNPRTKEIVAECSSSGTELCLCKRELQDGDFPAELELKQTLQTVDLSRNFLKEGLPRQIFHLPHLTTLILSRNNLRSLPPEIKNLTSLVELHALGNNFRVTMLPLTELASLPALRLLDLRYNPKLKQSAHDTLTSAFRAATTSREDPSCLVEILCTVPDPSEKTTTVSACDRDATLLRSQLEPLSTPQLRKRLERNFGVIFPQQDNSTNMDEEQAPQFNRDYVMNRLLDCYAKTPNSRVIRYERGIPVRSQLVQELIILMEAIDWSTKNRERPKIKAEYYMILQRPGSGQIDSARTRRETAKLNKYRAIFDKALQVIEETDPDYAKRFTALAVTKNFTGSPHIDTLNTSAFYGLSLGDFTPHDGGKIAVECSPTLVAEVDTRGRLAKVDGRFPHWVTPYDDPADEDGSGSRYSLIYYATSGDVVPQTTAIFEPRKKAVGDVNETTEVPWVPPPVFVL